MCKRHCWPGRFCPVWRCSVKIFASFQRQTSVSQGQHNQFGVFAFGSIKNHLLQPSFALFRVLTAILFKREVLRLRFFIQQASLIISHNFRIEFENICGMDIALRLSGTFCESHHEKVAHPCSSRNRSAASQVTFLPTHDSSATAMTSLMLLAGTELKIEPSLLDSKPNSKHRCRTC